MFQINNNINLKKIVIVSKTKWSIFLYCRLILRTLSGYYVQYYKYLIHNLSYYNKAFIKNIVISINITQ